MELFFDLYYRLIVTKNDTKGLIHIKGKPVEDSGIYNGDFTSIKKGQSSIKSPKEGLNIIGKIPLLFSAIPKTMPSKKVGGAVIISGTAILGTIAFISLQGYSADARNSKRSSDLSSIISKIVIEIVKGIGLKSFVDIDEQYAGKNIYVGGTKLILGKNYFVGKVNYTALDIKKSDFSDPNGDSYLIGVTTENGGKYEIGYFNETGNGKEFVVKGNYSPQKIKLFKITILGENTVKISDYHNANLLKIGNKTNLGRVVKVSDNGLIITLDKNVEKTSTNIYIIKNDAKSLIFTK